MGSFVEIFSLNPSLVVRPPIINASQALFEYPCTSEATCIPYRIFLKAGKYQIECWGSSGGYTVGYDHVRSPGGYTSGVIRFFFDQGLYLYIAGMGGDHTQGSLGGYNGGGIGYGGGGGGGGATDIRLIQDNYHSRLMVAGGGGGTDGYSHGGYAGGLNGADGVFSYTAVGLGGNQTHGGYGDPYGGFGYGGTSPSVDGAAGGAGYYGGGHGYGGHGGGGGGSSYVSGYDGCNAVSSSTSTSPTGQSIHYSGAYFTNPVILSGNDSFPSPSGSSNETGHTNHGFIRITCIYLFNEQCTLNLHRFDVNLGIQNGFVLLSYMFICISNF